ncbi:hypothetical protein TPHA_0B01770 [Tetrapisispora phaffii CBS 4417]|uniref:Damage-regulated import facilitator 1 n=1 Tax=Tetrapisispora phaffii (strain ATCC 24235 / CBS 4417 / NBRC 1672 / NRRL Y-8282 / UCD 70-5) TaxID=1071381 RepID=G8BPB9_TETPH|nr:hypothetical protein TPHA_0B01770 [Tetrapisispora phaffii CBS 4417]CCE61850.1 hypothetical protein TPHA_0B01770 [Tetrapisispora phaffii CBS 4417]
MDNLQTPPKKVQTSPATESSAQFSQYHNQLSSIGMRIRQSMDLNNTTQKYLNNPLSTANYSSMVVPGYKRQDVPSNVTVPMLVNEATMSSSNLDSMFTQQPQPQMVPSNEMNSTKRKRDF